MKKRIFRLAITLPVLLGAALGFAAPARAQEALLPQHKTWFEDVTPIITRVERDVFLKLRTSREREIFIRFFWKQRDPTPGTPENEFRSDYESRVRFADQNFSHGSSGRGSRSERGYYHLLLGPPLERTFYTTISQFWPLELWFYKGGESAGLPAYFYLIFYQPQGLGDYRLYYPGAEGPEKLIVPQMSSRATGRDAAYQTIKKVSAELAGATLSYLPGEKPFGLGSLSSDVIIASIRQLPEKRAADGYARSFLSYKDHIETDYSDAFIGCSFQVKVFAAAGQPFIHWTIEPDRMNMVQSGDAVVANFDIVLRLEDLSGTAVYETTEDVPLKLTPEEYKAHERRRFAFQDCLAAIPGTWKLVFLLKNKTGGDFTSGEALVVVPAVSGPPALGPLALYHGRQDLPAVRRDAVKAFAFGGRQYIVGARNEFLPNRPCGAYLQLLRGADLTGDAGLRVRWTAVPVEGGGPTILAERSLSEVLDASGGIDLGELSIAALAPGYYRADVEILGAGGRPILAQKENFIVPAPMAPAIRDRDGDSVPAREFPVVPWVYARFHDPFPGAEHLRVLGSERFLARDYAGAEEILRRGLALKDEPAMRLLLAKALYAQGRHRDSLSVADPLREAGDREAAKVVALDRAGLRDWAGALAVLERLLEGATEVGVLNLAAECQANLGRPELALPLVRKSLALSSDQPAMRALEERILKSLERK